MKIEEHAVTALRARALTCLSESDVGRKVSAVRQLAREWAAGSVQLDADATLQAESTIPGHPAVPELIAPRDVPRRAMHTSEGRAAMVHAMAHIEFNAINLALDAVWRFADMPRAYYADWLQVAEEEALHFNLLADHLQTLGYAYGDFPAHNGLWDMAEKTRHDVLVRMALLPRTLEARGLDVTPGMKARLVQAGDTAIAPIMDTILRDEVGHVQIGNRWYEWLCSQRGLEPASTYAALFADYHPSPLRGPFNLEARRAAGFSEAELRAMSAQG